MPRLADVAPHVAVPVNILNDEPKLDWLHRALSQGLSEAGRPLDSEVGSGSNAPSSARRSQTVLALILSEPGMRPSATMSVEGTAGDADIGRCLLPG